MKILAFIFTFISIAQASDAVFLKVLSRLNKDGILPTKNLMCKASGEEDDLAQACAVQLCGDPRTAKTAFITEEKIEQWTKDDKMKRFNEVEESINKILQFDVTDTRLIAAKLKEKMQSGEWKLDAAQLTDIDYAEMASGWFDRFVLTSADLDKPFPERVSVKTLSGKDISAGIKAGLESYAQEKLARIKQDFSEACFSEAYSMDEAHEELSRRFDLYEARLKQEAATRPELLELGKELAVLRAKLDAEDIKDVFDIGNLNSDLVGWDINLSNRISMPTLFPISRSLCVSSECRKGVHESFDKKDWGKLITDIESSVSDAGLAQQTLNNCRSEFAGMVLKESDTRAIKQALPLVREKFIDRVAKNFSEHSRQAFKDHLDNELNLVFGADVGQPLDEYIEEMKTSANTNTVVNLSNQSQILQALNERGALVETYSVLNKLACGEGLGASAWDAFMDADSADDTEDMPDDFEPGIDNVFISHFTCTHPEMGEQVLAHELGHVLSKAFSKKALSEESYKEFMRLRACVTGWNSGSGFDGDPYETGHAGDRWRTEEDQADLVAYMFGIDNPALMSCALVGQTYDSSSYASPSLKNSFDFDTHSSALTRAVREALHKGLPLPVACQQLVEKDPTWRYKTCL